MEKIKDVLKEIHLYPNKLEMLIKTSIWILSWLGGILAIHDASVKDGLASAYFIFALSLLMEFASKIMEKKFLVSKIIHTVFCFSIVTVFLVSSAILFGVNIGDGCYAFLFNITLIIIIFMIIVNVNIKMFKKWKIKMYSFPTFIPQLVPLYRLAFL